MTDGPGRPALSHPMDSEEWNEWKVVACLESLLREDASFPLHSVVIHLYKQDARIKVYIRDVLKETVVSLLQRYPQIFNLDAENSTVSLAKKFPVYSIEDISRHCTKDDAWIAVDGKVYDITEFVRTHWGWTSAGKE